MEQLKEALEVCVMDDHISDMTKQDCTIKTLLGDHKDTECESD